jgi:acetolactate synthase-1/2/3 large subunit
VKLLSEAEKPGIFVGWGARYVTDEIRKIAEHLGAPVATTLQGLAAFPGDHSLHTGMGFGPSSVPAAQNAFRDCDAMLAVGTRFAEICTGSYGAIPPEKLVHIDINKDALGRNYPTPVPIHADSRDAVPAIAERLLESASARDSAGLRQSIASDKKAWMEEWLAHDSGDRVNPGRFFSVLREKLDRDALVVADDGNHTFLTAELLPIYEGGGYISPTDFNCMGYCVPGSIGARLAQPGRQVIGIVGDGAFLMTGLEAVTAVQNELAVAWFVFNDGELSQIAQAQEMPYQRKTCTTVSTLNYEAFAAATGCEFVSIANNDEIETGIERVVALLASNRAVVVDVHIDYSKKTQFTIGTVKTNIKRFDTRSKLRIIGRALWRKVKNR